MYWFVLTCRIGEKMRYVRNSEELGRNIRFAREYRDLTQRELAQMLYVDRSSISYYESGKILPTVFLLIDLSKKLNIKLIWFLLVNKYHSLPLL